MKKEDVELLGGYCCFIIIMLFVFGCNTTKKTSSSSHSKIDSTGVTTKDSARVIKSDSTGQRLEQGQYEKVTVYAYDTIYTDTGTIKYVPRIITIYEKGSYNRAETAAKKNSDSTGVKQGQQVSVAKESKEAVKEKKSMRFPWWMAVVAVCCIGGYYAYRRYFS